MSNACRKSSIERVKNAVQFFIFDRDIVHVLVLKLKFKVRVFTQVAEFNTRNKFLTAKLFKQGCGFINSVQLYLKLLSTSLRSGIKI